jgi:hypothetical protein
MSLNERLNLCALFDRFYPGIVERLRRDGPTRPAQFSAPAMAARAHHALDAAVNLQPALPEVFPTSLTPVDGLHLFDSPLGASCRVLAAPASLRSQEHLPFVHGTK